MKKLSVLCLSLLSVQCLASGMLPQTSVLLVDEGKGEASMNITNTDAFPSLLYTKIVDLPGGDKSIQLIVTQPVVRVDAGQMQKIRFILHKDKPLVQEEMKRVVFEGIPPKHSGNNELKVTIRQDLPVIIHPAGLAEDLSPWKHLIWQKKGADLEVRNPSKYVVRMVASFKGLPSGKAGILTKTYLQPNGSITVKMPAPGDSKVEFYPASRYGYKGERYTASIQ